MIIDLSNTPTQHSVIGPSGASRWLKCPLSIELILKHGSNSGSSQAADTGTACHEIGALCLKGKHNPNEYMGAIVKVNGKSIVMNNKDIAGVRVYVDYVRKLVEQTCGVLYVEQELDMSSIHPEFFGCADAIVVTSDTIYVIDYKNGTSFVPSDEPQFLCYAVGALLKYKARQKIVTVVVQPNSTGDAIRSTTRSLQEVVDWTRGTLMPAVAKAFTTGNVPCKGEWCHYCKAKSFCPTSAVARTETADAPIAITKLPMAKDLTDEALAYVIHGKKALEEWLASVTEEGIRRATDGTQLKGLSLGQTRVTRSIGDTEKFIADISAVANVRVLYEEKLKTVAQLEKDLPKLIPDKAKLEKAQAILEAATVGKSNPTLVPSKANATEIFGE